MGKIRRRQFDVSQKLGFEIDFIIVSWRIVSFRDNLLEMTKPIFWRKKNQKKKKKTNNNNKTIINLSSAEIIITKTCLYNFDPLKPHFYIVKLGFTGVYIIFSFLLKNIDCGYSLEPPRRGGSNEYPQSMFWADIWKISEFFIWFFSLFGSKIFSIFI